MSWIPFYNKEPELRPNSIKSVLFGKNKCILNLIGDKTRDLSYKDVISLRKLYEQDANKYDNDLKAMGILFTTILNSFDSDTKTELIFNSVTYQWESKSPVEIKKTEEKTEKKQIENRGLPEDMAALLFEKFPGYTLQKIDINHTGYKAVFFSLANKDWRLTRIDYGGNCEKTYVYQTKYTEYDKLALQKLKRDIIVDKDGFPEDFSSMKFLTF